MMSSNNSKTSSFLKTNLDFVKQMRLLLQHVNVFSELNVKSIFLTWKSLQIFFLLFHIFHIQSKQ
jgi:hypothetical protein